MIPCLPRHGTLGAAKGAMEVRTRYLAAEMAPHGITVNAVSAGLVETDSARYYGGDAYEAWKARVIQATPKGRMGMPAGGALTLTAPSSAEGGDR